jgi:excinuclease ABC subunit C
MAASDPLTADLPRLARDLPRAPGVYLLKDRRGAVLYVGKSKNLRARVATYFQDGRGWSRDIKTEVMASKVADFEVIVTRSEFEALLLENTLIKDRKPRYNINLKDGKSYPVIRLTNEQFPKVFRTRTIVLDGSEYFGPFPKVNQIDIYLTLIDKLFPLRKRGNVFKERDQPCLNFHIGRCAAPCVGNIGADEYQERVAAVRKLLTGKSADLLRELRARMEAEAKALRFEKAAVFRDQVRAISEVTDSDQNVVDFSREARDYVGYHRDGSHYTVALFQFRHGQLIGKERFRLVDEAPPEEVLPSFLLQFYAGVQTRPRTVFLRLPPDTAEVLQNALDRALAPEPPDVGSATGGTLAAPATVATAGDTDTTTQPSASSPPGETAAEHGVGQPVTVAGTGGAEAGSAGGAAGPGARENVTAASSPAAAGTEGAVRGRRAARLEVRVPQRGKHVRFLRMAEHNAQVEWENSEKKRAGRDAQFQVLEDLRAALQLDAAPRRIEAFDISHLEGSDAVASLVVFVDGRPEKQSYRHFRLRSLDGKVDDYAAMREVVARRYTRAVNDNRALPDLVLVDGGKGQVSAATRILRALELDSVPVAGLAKRNEEVFVPGRSAPVALPDGSPALRLLQAARDESHRFANSFNRRLRGKRVSLSMLETVNGIGRARSRRLLEAFGSVPAMLAAGPEAIAARAGVTRETAATLLAHLEQQHDTEVVAAAVPSTPD